ncbi:lantibiotic dehydratase [Streptomyces sp. NPDC097619]|uniref:lantibiotic dehydratase n=1 Tax=Streptomyces sp. NPDC097619 TaxID=3157228 RepID=UPI0033276F8C
MPHPAQSPAPVRSTAPAPAPPPAPDTDTGTGTGTGTAPYALVRTAVLPYPAEAPDAAPFRALVARLTRLAAQEARLRAPLTDDLHDSRPEHDERFHRQVVLPLRRDLHNGRTPRPALLARLGDLPDRVPRLADWLELHAERARLLAALTAAAPAALDAERALLAAWCRSPAFHRAVALSGSELLGAVARAGRGDTGRRARKAEPAVLRQALRAAAKTSPLTWYTAVGWLPGGAPGTATDRPVPLTAVVRGNRTLVTALTAALLDEPRRRRGLPHRLSSSVAGGAGAARFARSDAVFGGGRYLITHEEEVAVAAPSAALAALTRLTTVPEPLGRLTDRLALALGRPPGDRAVAGFLDRLAETGLLVPAAPVDPQHPRALTALADWLRRWPEDAALAARLDRIAADTDRFGSLPAADRPERLDALAASWRHLLADAGRPVPADAAPLTVLTEDVLAVPEPPRHPRPDRPPVPRPGPRPAPSPGPDPGPSAGAPRPRPGGTAITVPGPGTGPGSADREALTELTALAELFDLGHLMRWAARDRFTARYGIGGTCADPWEFGADTAAAWEDATRLASPGAARGRPAPLAALLELREELLRTGRSLGGNGTGALAPEAVLPLAAVRDLADRLPPWTSARPLSYAWFLQSDPDSGLLAVNHVYGGWGRFTSRFLDPLGPGPTAQVARQLRRALGPGTRAAQIRPVGGFNANLHPLLLPDEVGPDRYRTSLSESGLELWHDPVTEQLRFRVRATGDLLDVLYLGFLAPVMLPQRLAPYLNDHPAGMVDFRGLAPRETVPAPGGEVLRAARLRHRHLVLSRRRWHLPEGVLAAWRADLAADLGEPPVATTARWRALLDLPEQLFLHPVPAGGGRPAEELVARLRGPKPQALDLGNALHLRCLAGWLARHPGGVVLEEALPAPGGRPTARHTTETVLETYRPGRTR